MNEVNGLPSLPDKSVDLCLTDPPWNINYKGMKSNCAGPKGDNSQYIMYDDNIDNYKDFCINLFKELNRICKRIIIAPGRQNLHLWYNISHPLDIIIHYKKNGGFGGNLSVYNNFDVFLYYGEKVSKPYYINNVIEEIATWGWLKKQLPPNQRDFLHPCPKNYKVWFKLINGIKPKSIIDPFMGSGTTAAVCTKLGIPWIGYEINEIYSQDINRRLKNCVKEPTQHALEAFL